MKTIISFLFFLLCTTAVYSQGLQFYLESVENFNPMLKAVSHETEAAKIEAFADNLPGDPNVEFSGFYDGQNPGMASTELVVTMGFDFPTLYVSRHRAGKSLAAFADLQYLLQRRDLLLDAAQGWIDYVTLCTEQKILQVRVQYADSLAAVLETGLGDGNVTALDLNYAKLDAMSAKAALAQNNAALEQLAAKLSALNAGAGVDTSALEYPAVRDIVYNDSIIENMLDLELEVRAAEAKMAIARQQLKVDRQGWIPTFEAGYRRNVDTESAANGFLVAANFPIFSNISKNKGAKAALEVSKAENDAVRSEAEARIKGGLKQLQSMAATISCFDTDLIYGTLALMRKAVDSGSMSITDYYSQASELHEQLLEINNLQNEYHKAVLEVFKNYL